MTPEGVKEVLGKFGGTENYDPGRSNTSGSVYGFKDHEEVTGILKNKKFKHPFLKRISGVIHGPGFFLCTESSERREREYNQMLKVLAETPEKVEAITSFFYESTKALIAEESYTLGGGKANAVRDVFRVIPTRVATQVAGISLNVSESYLERTFTETELLDALSDIYSFCFLGIEVFLSWD